MFSPDAHPTDTDIVSLAALRLATTIGRDHWHRTRPQPIELSLYLHLVPLYLNEPGKSDDVADSLHYGHLATALERRVSEKAEAGYTSSMALAEDMADAAFAFARDVVGQRLYTDGDAAVGEVVHVVRVVLSLPKQILLAGGFEIELTTHASDWIAARSALIGGTDAGMGVRPGATVRVMGLVLPVVIGVNPPERLVKQRVVTDLTFLEAARTGAEDGELDYPTIVKQVATDVECSAHLTLEKLVYEIIKTAYRTSDAVQSDSNTTTSRIVAITVRCQKPSALSFADASCVEMTRTRREAR